MATKMMTVPMTTKTWALAGSMIFLGAIVFSPRAVAAAAAKDATPAKPSSAMTAKQDLDDPMGKLLVRAQAGEVAAQLLAGEAYEQGNLVGQSDVEAAAWYWRAAQSGSAEARVRLARLYGAGRAYARPDFVQAARWLRHMAERGFPGAQNRLGEMYLEGRGVPMEHAEAVKWLRRAANQGLPTAQARMAELYAAGLGVPRNMKESQKWLRKAAKSSHPPEKKSVPTPSTRPIMETTSISLSNIELPAIKEIAAIPIPAF